MSILTENSLTISNSQEVKQKFSQLMFRIWPYWPIIFIALILGVCGSYLYLKKATRLYEVRAQIVVSDDSQNKNNNLNKTPATIDQFSQLSQVEKQIEIIKSKALLEGVVQKFTLNAQWSKNKSELNKGTIINYPVTIYLDSPQTVNEIIEGQVITHSEKRQVEFNGIFYPVDTIITTSFGNCKWYLNSFADRNDDTLYLRILPFSDYTDLLKSRFEAIQHTKQSPIVNLSLIDEIPERAKIILNSIINYYGETNLKIKEQLHKNALRFIDERLDLVSRNLRVVESSLQNYKSREGITDLTTEGQIYLGQVKDNDKLISEIDVQINILNEIEQYLSKRNQSTGSLPATLGLSDQVLVTLLSELLKDESEREKLFNLSGEKNPQVKILDDRIEQRKNGILESVRNLRNSLQTSRQTLQVNNSKYSESLRGIPQKEKTLIEISRNQTIKNELYTFLLQKREEAAIAAASISPDYSVIENPEFYGLVKPKPILIYSYGLLIVFTISGLWIYRMEFANNSILYRSEIENRTNIPIIGEFIYDQSANGDGIVVKSKSRTLIAEQFRDLRANIIYLLHKKKEGKIVLITSSMPDEGKSFVSVNLAISFALSGKKTALVEFDLYKPRISMRLGVKNNPGISDFLINKAAEIDICLPYEKIENLWLVSSGTQLENPAELILNEKLHQLIGYLKKEFEVIIIDSPCVGMVSDTKILAPYANMTLYIIRQNFTHHGFIKFINELDVKGTVPRIQIVYNGVKIKRAPGLDYWDSYGVNGYRFNNKNPYNYSDDSKKQKRKSEKS